MPIQQAILDVIKSEIVSVEDFPKRGITFRDMMPVLYNPDLLGSVIDLWVSTYEPQGIDIIAGLESRGFLLGAPLALKMQKPFLAVRKKGKLPRPSHRLKYVTEYSEDEIEISVGEITGKTVLIVDDLLATGGTLRAAETLFTNAGAKKVLSTCLIELLGLGGREKLSSPFISLVQF